MFRAGQLKYRISIYTLSTDTTESGDLSESWSLLASRLAAIRPLSSRERERANGVAAAATHSITMRYVAGVEHASKIVFGSRTFFVQSVINADEAGDSLTVLATEIVN